MPILGGGGKGNAPAARRESPPGRQGERGGGGGKNTTLVYCLAVELIIGRAMVFSHHTVAVAMAYHALASEIIAAHGHTHTHRKG